MVEDTDVEELPADEDSDAVLTLVELTVAEDTDVEELQVVEDNEVDPELVEHTAVEDSPRK